MLAMANTFGRISASCTSANRLGRLLYVRALLLVAWPPLIASPAAHTASARHHASTTADHADNKQHNNHNRQNILQIHIRLQAAEIKERGVTLTVSSNVSVAPLSLQAFAWLRS
jgi:hypothetical protein